VPGTESEKKFYSVVLFVTDEHVFALQLAGDETLRARHLAGFDTIASATKVRGCKSWKDTCHGPQPGKLKTVAPDTAEMKRLYVRSSLRGQGWGRALAEAAATRARELGYRKLFLDTLPAMTEARALYAHMGFEATAPYYLNPVEGVTMGATPPSANPPSSAPSARKR
jgi:ribosomal protein S18 acetylase RimI-like enzyme